MFERNSNILALLFIQIVTIHNMYEILLFEFLFKYLNLHKGSPKIKKQ